MLTGTWIPQSAEFSGQPLDVPSARLVITGNAYVLESADGRDGGVLRLNEAASPAELDFVGTHGAHAGRTIPAIFRQRGNLLQLCYRVGEGSGPQLRPTTLTAEPGSVQILLRYRRVEP